MMFCLISSDSLAVSSIRNPFHTINRQPSFSRKQNNTENPIQSIFINIHYANAKDIVKFIANKNLGLLSAQGHISADARTNSIWLSDFSRNTTKIKRLIKKLDAPVKQILIKARIVNVDNAFVKDLGVIFKTHTDDTKSTDKLAMDLPIQTQDIGEFTIPIAKLGDLGLLDLQLNALEKEGHAKLISSPELMTLNRKAAVIESGQEVPYQQQTGEGNTTVAFKKAVLRLKVIPQIMPNHRVLLNLAVNQDKVGTLTVNGVPAIRTQRLNTQVLVKNGQTIVLGGIFETVNSQQEEGVPLLRKIPLLGVLFRRRTRVSERKELLIFVTPMIIN